MSEIRSSWHLESRLAIPPGRYIPPKLAKEVGATQHVSVYWPSWKEPLPKSPHRYDPEIRKRLIAAQELLDAPRTFVASSYPDLKGVKPRSRNRRVFADLANRQLWNTG